MLPCQSESIYISILRTNKLFHEIESDDNSDIEMGDGGPTSTLGILLSQSITYVNAYNG